MNWVDFRKYNLLLLLYKGEISREYFENYHFENYCYIYPDRNNRSFETENYYDEDENLWLIGENQWVTSDGFIIDNISLDRNYFRNELKHINEYFSQKTA